MCIGGSAEEEKHGHFSKIFFLLPENVGTFQSFFSSAKVLTCLLRTKDKTKKIKQRNTITAYLNASI